MGDAGMVDSGPLPVDVGPVPDETAPVVTSTRPADGAELVSRGAEVEVRFSEAVVLASGTITVTSEGMAVALDAATLDPEGDVVRVRPTGGMWPGGARVDVSVAGFADAAGNVMEGTHDFVFHTNDDGAPTVVESTPAEGATGVDLALATITVRFSEPMNPVLGVVTLEGGPGTLGAQEWSSDRELRVTVSGLRAGTAYRLVLAEFEDRSGNVLDGTPVLGDSAIDFTTIADTTAPTVVDSNPTHMQLDVEVSALTEITVTFSEPMDTSVRNAVLTDGMSFATLRGNWSADALTIRFYVVGRLVVDAENRLDLSMMRDAAGNALDGTVGLADGDLVFTTSAADERFPFVVFSTPIEGATGVSTRLPSLTFLFSEAMDVTRTSIDVVSAAGTRTLTGSWNIAGTRLTIPATVLGPRTAYTVDLRTFEDASGNALDATHPYLVDGILQFATGSASGENCADPLTTADASATAAGFEWELVPGQFNIDDGQPTCSVSTTVHDGVLAYVKTTADLAGGGRALRITATSPEDFNGVQLEVFRDVCDRTAVGGGDAARQVCLTQRTRWVQYLDVPAGTYYVWVANEGTPFEGATVRIEEVATISEGELCHDPFDAMSSIHTSPATDEHVWTIPHGSGTSVDFGTSSNGAGSIPCHVRQGPDAVVRVDKARSTSILDVQVDPFPADTSSSGGSLDRGGVVVGVLDACSSRATGTTVTTCPGRINTPEGFQIQGAAGDYYVWLAANNSEVDQIRTTLRVREIDPGPGQSCQTAIPITPGSTVPVTPSSTERFFVPSCMPATGGVTWYRFTSTRELSLATLSGMGALAMIDATSGAELGCIADGRAPLPYRAAPGRAICLAVPSGTSVTGLTVRQADWRGVNGVPTDLMIAQPISDTGTPVSLTGESFLAVTPTQLYLGINQNSTSTTTTIPALVTAPRAGGTTADRIPIDRFTFGSSAATIGESLFSVEETNRPARLHRLVDSTGMLSPTVWDTGSVYTTAVIAAMALVESSNTFIMATRSTSATVPTIFYSASATTPGAVTMLGSNSMIRDVVAIESDGTWVYLIGNRPAGTTAVRSVYRLRLTDLSATPELMVSDALVGFSTTQGSMVLDPMRDILYFRSTDIPRGVHAIFDASAVDPVYVGPVFVRGTSSDHGLAYDPSIPALYLFETESVSTGAFIELR